MFNVIIILVVSTLISFYFLIRKISVLKAIIIILGVLTIVIGIVVINFSFDKKPKEPAKEDSIKATVLCNMNNTYDRHFYLEFIPCSINDFTNNVITLHKDSTGRIVERMQQKLDSFKTDNLGEYIGNYKYTSAIGLRDTIEIIFNEKKYILSDFKLRASGGYAGIPPRLILSDCVLDSITINRKRLKYYQGFKIGTQIVMPF